MWYWCNRFSFPWCKNNRITSILIYSNPQVVVGILGRTMWRAEASAAPTIICIFGLGLLQHSNCRSHTNWLRHCLPWSCAKLLRNCKPQSAIAIVHGRLHHAPCFHPQGAGGKPGHFHHILNGAKIYDLQSGIVASDHALFGCLDVFTNAQTIIDRKFSI